ncbi:hypothetical protein H8356DRAFT_1626583 [Neocallimastix lanati (nom. inval.)]|jgi:NACalpha-BTF3-like transcription factor|uniref:Nascent polypeptide-associated complex subunit alpha-like UBA domain-containing protein n=1 Tax=Neocallimastix californiae TaxID=1754190 RepID=A0A1Y2BG24_9FUNG|nr:hypothetical protein H8356DRAFT_1626583 [Neocallimastix sp. JGI-2020a]ORY33666.1 hypothetical protein LY90DRAFT_705094 [Neocallimastix californiae]|eukprot:ORY33666.1 hypothetical protein LY90DRAFT_705094 [Neocallimastix californiae]
MSNNKKDKANANAKAEGEEEQQQKGHQGMAAKDMKNITDYFEELEHKHDEDKLNKALNVASEEKKKSKSLLDESKKNTNSIKLSKEDIDVVMNELDVTKAEAEKYLRENNGDLEATIRYIIDN